MAARKTTKRKTSASGSARKKQSAAKPSRRKPTKRVKRLPERTGRARVREEPDRAFQPTGESADENVFTIIQDLQGQLESSFLAKGTLEEDLAKANEKVLELRSLTQQQEKEIQYLQEKVSMVETLREELDFIEQEKSKAQALITALEKERATFSMLTVA